MTQVESLVKWARQSNVNVHQDVIAMGDRLTLVDENPTRIYLRFNLQVFTGRVIFFPVDLQNNSGIQGGSAVGTLTDIEFTVDRQYKLTQCQWDVSPLDGPLTINIVEIIYRGG